MRNFGMIFVGVCLLFVICFGYLNGEGTDEVTDLETWLPVGYRSFCEWDTDRGVFVGMMIKEGEKVIVAVDGATGGSRVVGRAPVMDGWIGSASALVDGGRDFACLGIEKRKHVVCWIPLEGSGKTRKIEMDVPVTVIEGIDEKGVLVGLGRIKKEYWLISIDYKSLLLKKVMKVVGLERISGAVHWHSGLRRLLALGVFDGRMRLVLIDIEGKGVETLDGVEILLNEFKVEAMNGVDERKVIFTTGVQACTAVAGYCRKTGIGFLTHVSHRNRGIEGVVDGIVVEALKKTGGSGIKEMEIALIGGVKGQVDSEGNLRRAFLRLVGQHGVDRRKIQSFSTSTSWNVVIVGGEIVVF